MEALQIRRTQDLSSLYTALGSDKIVACPKCVPGPALAEESVHSKVERFLRLLSREIRVRRGCEGYDEFTEREDQRTRLAAVPILPGPDFLGGA